MVSNIIYLVKMKRICEKNERERKWIDRKKLYRNIEKLEYSIENDLDEKLINLYIRIHSYQVEGLVIEFPLKKHTVVP